MATLPVVTEGEILKRACMRALEEGTSVNAFVRDYLAEYSRMKAHKENAINDLLRLSGSAKIRRGSRRWRRDDLHQR